jgi:hypothetical protein
LNNNSGGSQFLTDFANPVYGFAADIGSIYNWGNTPTPTITFGFGSSSQSVTLPYYLVESSANTLIHVASTRGEAVIEKIVDDDCILVVKLSSGGDLITSG